jgi:hypothetical protein
MAILGLVDGKVVPFFLLILAFALFYFFMDQAKRGVTIKARTFPAVAAIAEAIGRAAEMGKPVYYTTGEGSNSLNSEDAPQVLAGISILRYTTKLCARNGVRPVYFTPIADSLPLVEETMRTAYLEENKPEEFNPVTNINYMEGGTPYMSASIGWIQRERPAASILLGAFWSETTNIAEAGNTIGAMQIGGTAIMGSLPILVATCDYTLIMEELYAAAAHISGNADVLGTLRGADFLKYITIAIVVIGFLLGLANSNSLIDILRV